MFVAAGITPLLIAPLTIIVLDKTNNPLKALEKKARIAVEKGEGSDEPRDETKEQLLAWKSLNAVRSLLPFAGAVMAGVALYM